MSAFFFQNFYKNKFLYYLLTLRKSNVILLHHCYTAKGIKLYNMNSHDLQVVDKIKQGNSGL